MDIPVFDLKNLRRYFYYFLAACVLIAIMSIVVMIFTGESETRQILERINTWYLIIFIFFGTYIFNLNSKKELNRIIDTINFEEKFRKYEIRYKKRLIWNALSIAFSGIFLIITQKNLLLYILIIQLVLTPLFYPRKFIITKELKNDEIVFT